MSSSNNTFNKIPEALLEIYDKFMYLKVFVDSEDNNLKHMYLAAAERHNKKIHRNPECIDAGFDLFAPPPLNQNQNQKNNYCGEDTLHFYGTGWQDMGPVNKLDYKICCSAKMLTSTGKQFNTGYYMYPRSSLSKTQLRLANSTGIIDAGYRGHLIGMFDVVNIQPDNVQDIDADYYGKAYDRYLQICAPGLVPILVEIVDSKEELGEVTERGDGGFGSTGR